MRNLIAKFLFGVEARDIDSLRSQNNSLQARLDALVDERDELRRQLLAARAEEITALKIVIDGERIDARRVPLFNLGPKPPEPATVHIEQMTSLSHERQAQERNREFLETHRVVPHSGWDEPNKPAEAN